VTSVTEVPYDADGNLLHYASPWSRPEMRPNVPFRAVLQITGMESGRSAKYVMLADRDGHTYPMFVTDLLDLLARSGAGVKAGITGTEMWIVRKRGQNYGVALAPTGMAL
jgi:hypothetical protein